MLLALALGILAMVALAFACGAIALAAWTLSLLVDRAQLAAKVEDLEEQVAEDRGLREEHELVERTLREAHGSVTAELAEARTTIAMADETIERQGQHNLQLYISVTRTQAQLVEKGMVLPC